jgi:hypothetical protein
MTSDHPVPHPIHGPAVDRPAQRGPWPASLLTAGALPRLAGALALVALLWLAVAWAIVGVS